MGSCAHGCHSSAVGVVDDSVVMVTFIVTVVVEVVLYVVVIT